MSLGDQAIQFAARAGLFLDPWQQDVLRGAMGRVPGGRWAARNVGLLVPRQNGKGAVLEAREMFGMFVLAEPLIIHSAHKFDTSQQHFGRMLNLIDGNPDLKKHVKHVYAANGKESIHLKNGSVLKFKARTADAARGFSCETLILDEAMLLSEEAASAMRPTLITRPEAQIWYTSSAGLPDSTVLWRLVKRGRAKSQRLAYWEWGCAPGVDPADRGEWLKANPAIGYRLDLDDLEDEFENGLVDDFAREHLGIWDDQARVTVFPSGKWEALADSESEITGSVTFAVEVAEDRKWSCIAAAGVGPAAVHVESVDYRPGTGWVVGRAKELAKKHQTAAFVVQPSSPAGSLIADLEAVHVPVEKASAQDYAQACGDFYDAVIDAELRHLGQGELDVSVDGAVKRTSGDAWVWDRRKSVDISPLAACTLAFWGHVTRPQATPNIW